MWYVKYYVNVLFWCNYVFACAAWQLPWMLKIEDVNMIIFPKAVSWAQSWCKANILNSYPFLLLIFFFLNVEFKICQYIQRITIVWFFFQRKKRQLCENKVIAFHTGWFGLCNIIILSSSHHILYRNITHFRL